MNRKNDIVSHIQKCRNDALEAWEGGEVTSSENCGM